LKTPHCIEAERLLMAPTHRYLCQRCWKPHFYGDALIPARAIWEDFGTEDAMPIAAGLGFPKNQPIFKRWVFQMHCSN